MHAPQPRPEPRPTPGADGPIPDAQHYGKAPPPPSPSVEPRVVFMEERRPMHAWLRIPLTMPLLAPLMLAFLVAVFVAMSVAGGSIDATEREGLLLRWGAKTNVLVADGEWWRLITATFLHGGILHMLLNGFALLMVGIDTEAFFGRARFLAIYAISALAGSVASFALGPFNATGVGASGAIFGLVGALAVYFGLYRNLYGKLGNTQFWLILGVIVLNVGFGFSGIFPVDNAAHIGGLLAGATVGYVLGPRYALGDWTRPNVRALVNVNLGTLPWLAAGLIGLNVLFLYFAALLLFKTGTVQPVYIIP